MHLLDIKVHKTVAAITLIQWIQTEHELQPFSTALLFTKLWQKTEKYVTLAEYPLIE